MFMTVSHDITKKEMSSCRKHWDKIYSAYYWLSSDEAEENASTAYITKNYSDMFINDLCEYVGKKVDSVFYFSDQQQPWTCMLFMSDT